ncbi:ComEC/Rec2 family competence protein, partial [Patescibacteria group bacterium]|nr:ComEC/Rec2 family competence protein [Patescibacteria group bacterium]
MLSVSDFTHIIECVLPEPHAGLLSGVLFGTKMSIDPVLKQALVTTGTLHIIALSGMNITILTSIVNISLLWLFPRKIASIATIVVIIGFILFVGPSASVIRAGIMGGVSLLAIIFGKNLWALWSWGMAVVGMLLVRPMWITDLSFQLSVLASLGIICFGKPSTVASTIPDGTGESNWSDLEKKNRRAIRRRVMRHLREVLWDDL